MKFGHGQICIHEILLTTPIMEIAKTSFKCRLRLLLQTCLVAHALCCMWVNIMCRVRCFDHIASQKMYAKDFHHGFLVFAPK